MARTMLTMSCKVDGIQKWKKCSKDFLQIDKVKYCGDKKPPSMMEKSSFSVVFKSDKKTQSKGFRCVIKSTGKYFGVCKLNFFPLST